VKPFYLCLAGALALSSPASAKIVFSAYDGPNAVVTGKGGAKITEQGIDWWTDGDPPRSYRILGLLTDDRGTGRFNGDTIGSKKVAGKVRDLGGNAVIVYRQSERTVGASIFGHGSTAYNNYQGNFATALRTRKATTLVVIKVEN